MMFNEVLAFEQRWHKEKPIEKCSFYGNWYLANIKIDKSWEKARGISIMHGERDRPDDQDEQQNFPSST